MGPTVKAKPKTRAKARLAPPPRYVISKAAFARLEKICLALPEATGERMADHHAFKVKGKTFVWQLNDHHGDGRVAIVCKVAPGVATTLVTAVRGDGARYFIPPYLGPKGWVGMRLEGAVPWNDVAMLVNDSYRLIAPKRLVASLDER